MCKLASAGGTGSVEGAPRRNVLRSTYLTILSETYMLLPLLTNVASYLSDLHVVPVVGTWRPVPSKRIDRQTSICNLDL
jgi:hypothetical protein